MCKRRTSGKLVMKTLWASYAAGNQHKLHDRLSTLFSPTPHLACLPFAFAANGWPMFTSLMVAVWDCLLSPIAAGALGSVACGLLAVGAGEHAARTVVGRRLFVPP